MMDAWVNKKIKSELDVHVNYLDIQELNQAALLSLYDVTKISAASLPLVNDEYELLDAGAAMGFGAGPLIVARASMDIANLDQAKIAVPGKHTTAHYLLNLFYPNIGKKEFMLFSDIEDAVVDGRVDAGVLIHENRFTYHLKNLIQLVDLGVLWEQTHKLPLPLGVMVCRKSLRTEVKQKINKYIKESVQFAFDHPKDSRDYVLEHAQEMSPEVVAKHIALYVNAYSLSMGQAGLQALNFLILQSQTKNNIA